MTLTRFIPADELAGDRLPSLGRIVVPVPSGAQGRLQEALEPRPRAKCANELRSHGERQAGFLEGDGQIGEASGHRMEDCRVVQGRTIT